MPLNGRRSRETFGPGKKQKDCESVTGGCIDARGWEIFGSVPIHPMVLRALSN